jgi:DNA-binding CsgD family transcriptional regulator
MNQINEKTVSGLTVREVEVWQLIAEGLANKQIAHVLFICTKTVEKHRQHLMDKLRIHNVAGLTRYAIAEGIITAVPKCRLELDPDGLDALGDQARRQQHPRRFQSLIATVFDRAGGICNVPPANLVYEPKFSSMNRTVSR